MFYAFIRHLVDLAPCSFHSAIANRSIMMVMMTEGLTRYTHYYLLLFNLYVAILCSQIIRAFYLCKRMTEVVFDNKIL